MALNPAGVEIKKIENVDQYLDELYGAGPEGLPGFYEFLENMRGIPRDTFTREQYMMVALNSEMMYYSMFVQAAQAQKQRVAAEAEQKAAYLKELKTLGTDELVAHAQLVRKSLGEAEEAAANGYPGAAEAVTQLKEQISLVEAEIVAGGAQADGEAA